MTVDNKDVAVPVATTPSPEMLMNMYYNFFNSGMGQVRQVRIVFQVVFWFFKASFILILKSVSRFF